MRIIPTGVRPHTTAPLDYLIVLLGKILRPFSRQWLDLAGALISPVLALAGGWLLLWWSRNLSGLCRWGLLLLYALSGILAHGTALGRPDQQSLLIVTLLVALVAEWQLERKPDSFWSVVSGAAWGISLWVSLYEPLILLGGLLAFSLLTRRREKLFANSRRIGWLVMLGVLLVAAIIERRLPEWPTTEPFFANWAAAIGELQRVSLGNPSWLYWTGGLLLASPFLLMWALRRGLVSGSFAGLLGLTFLFTIWQARWGYFFALLFLLTIPAQLTVLPSRALRCLVAVLALWPLLQFWDGQFWPNEEARERLARRRREMVEWREVASSLGGKGSPPILAPWWWAPATAYWSGQPVVAGSSHESLPGTVATARFFLATSPQEAAAILRSRRIRWVLAGDGEEAVSNSAAILGRQVPPDALGATLDRAPSRAPVFLRLRLQNDAVKLYQVAFSRENSGGL